MNCPLAQAGGLFCLDHLGRCRRICMEGTPGGAHEEDVQRPVLSKRARPPAHRADWRALCLAGKFPCEEQIEPRRSGPHRNLPLTKAQKARPRPCDLHSTPSSFRRGFKTSRKRSAECVAFCKKFGLQWAVRHVVVCQMSCLTSRLSTGWRHRARRVLALQCSGGYLANAPGKQLSLRRPVRGLLPAASTCGRTSRHGP